MSYIKTYEEFIQDIIHGDCIVEEIKKYSKIDFKKGEKNAFRNSLGALSNALRNVTIPKDAQVGLEFEIPSSEKRIDFVIAGEDKNHRKNVVIVELKQWDDAEYTDDNSKVSIDSTKYKHPLWQVTTYSNYLSDYIYFIYTEDIHIIPCVFLHNYQIKYISKLQHGYTDKEINNVPMFVSNQWEEFAKFVSNNIVFKCDVDILHGISNSKCLPSPQIAEYLKKIINDNPRIILSDQQNLVKSSIISIIDTRTDCKKVIIIKGGVGTGKSLIALHILSELVYKSLSALYVAKSKYVRACYNTILNNKLKHTINDTKLCELFGYLNSSNYKFDCLIVDEAHRLTNNSDDNSIKTIIQSTNAAVFFIDETQQIDIKDYGTIETIKAAAKEEDAEIIEDNRFVLHSQFRCNGSDDYIAWVESVLYNKEYISSQNVDYDIKIFDDLNEMHNAIREKNKMSQTPSRMLSGDVFPWNSQKDKTAFDITIGNYQAQWNKSDIFAIDCSSIDEVGCIHTSQGMEFEYAGLIVGNDLLYRNDQVITDYKKHPSGANEFRRYKQRKILKEDVPQLDRIIRNTYKVLFTRGQKGLYLYIMDEKLKGYLINRLKDLCK